jgi:hypothetical protein
MKNIIAIDPSLISTGIYVNGKLINYCRESDAYNKSGLSKWFKMCEGLIDLRFVDYREYKDYSEGELTKLKDYDKITDSIISDIEKNIDKSLETHIAIEGYNFASSVGDIIDLVTFSTILRKKLWDYISKDIWVVSPLSLKLEACKLTYEPINIGKKKEKLVWRNNIGIAGGHFTKREIFLSIAENNFLNDDWSNHIKSISKEMLENKTIKKPYEDINDCYVLAKVLEKKFGII